MPGSPDRRENSVATVSNFCVLCFPLSSPSHILMVPQTTGLWVGAAWSEMLSQNDDWIQRAEMKPLGCEWVEQVLTMPLIAREPPAYVAFVPSVCSSLLTCLSGQCELKFLSGPTSPPRSLLSKETFWTGGLDGTTCSKWWPPQRWEICDQ